MLVVTCTIERRRPKLAVHLFCPLAPEPRQCFQDCQHTCIRFTQSDTSKNFSENGNFCPNVDLLSAVKCSLETESDSPDLTVSYRFSRYDPEITGQWFCAHDGPRSVTILLRAEPRPTTSTTTTTTTTTTTSTTAAPTTASTPITTVTTLQTPSTTSIPIIPTPSTVKPRDDSWKNKHGDNQNGQNIGWSFEKPPRSDVPWNHAVFYYLTKTDVVLIVLLILLLSLLVNISFCIRCLLVRRYISAELEGREESKTCAEFRLTLSGTRFFLSVAPDFQTAV